MLYDGEKGDSINIGAAEEDNTAASGAVVAMGDKDLRSVDKHRK